MVVFVVLYWRNSREIVTSSRRDTPVKATLNTACVTLCPACTNGVSRFDSQTDRLEAAGKDWLLQVDGRGVKPTYVPKLEPVILMLLSCFEGSLRTFGKS